jgi:hypothetical protein
MVDFFIIGAQKSGTESAIFHLNQHKDLQIHPNEIHFFDNNNFNYNLNYYHSIFGSKRKKLLGEKTPSYCYLKFAMDRIYNYNPNAKLVFLLREPISRAFSQWNMYNHLGKPIENFIPSIQRIEHIQLNQIDKNGYWALQRGFYFKQIKQILTLFPKENLYVGISEKIKKNPLEEYNKILDFLGVERLDSLNFNDSIHKRNYSRKITQEEINYLYPKYHQHNQKLFDFLGYEIEEWKIR